MDDEHLTESDRAGEVEQFRRLPPRVRPEEMVETAETRAARGRPEAAGTEDEYNLRAGGAG